MALIPKGGRLVNEVLSHYINPLFFMAVGSVLTAAGIKCYSIYCKRKAAISNRAGNPESDEARLLENEASLHSPEPEEAVNGEIEEPEEATEDREKTIDTPTEISLNEDQEKTLKKLLELYDSNEPFYHFVSGPAGTGKSTVLHKYADIIRKKSGSRSLLVMAYTGIAAVNAKGSTIHSALRFSIEEHPDTKELEKLKDDIEKIVNLDAESLLKNLRELLREHSALMTVVKNCNADLPFDELRKLLVKLENCEVQSLRDVSQRLLDELNSLLSDYKNYNAKSFSDPVVPLRKQLKNLKIIIIDEISFVGSAFLKRIDERLNEVFYPDKPFGGKSVVAFGDLLQLPPVVKGEPNARIFPAVDGSESLWSLFKISELEINERTNNETEAKLLASIRQGTMSEKIKKDLEEYYLIKNLKWCEVDRNRKNAKAIFEELNALKKNNKGQNFIIIAATNVIVDSLNGYIISKMNYVSDFYTKVFNGTDKRSFFYTSDDVPKTLSLAVGLKVMTTINNKLRGIVNGLIGIVTKIEDDGVTIKFDDRGEITVRRVNFKVYNEKKKVYEKYSQFPIAPAEAITIHKSQGSTFDGVIIVSDWTFNPVGMFYTALSRARNLSLTRITNIDNAKWNACERSKAELKKMRDKNNNSIPQDTPE